MFSWVCCCFCCVWFVGFCFCVLLFICFLGCLGLVGLNCFLVFGVWLLIVLGVCGVGLYC